ncbi:hypothetical protein NE562_04630 [Butyricicoccus faecihominis]|uniref:hypothetical protein n=1 Tax=Butyricicoccus faecihominis TaxID=1712515 RepID=UPI00247A8273|nr:hypothetical protein [Butyricicoccus faecihominis]MCQ5128935.1 hypothetical protein [Butyricicoccus faecihominis]
MITGVIKNNARTGSTLIVTLPCNLYDLRDHLASIGITSEASKLTVGGTENIKVQLAAEEPVGELVLSKLAQDDTLTGLNVACQEIRKNCPYGYEEFMDMLSPKKDVLRDRFHFYQQYCTTPPSTATGVKYLIEEADRYRITMENYTRACKAAEDEEYELPEDDGWER